MNRKPVLTAIAFLTFAAGVVTASAAQSALRNSASPANAGAPSHRAAGQAAASQAHPATAPAAAKASHANSATRSSTASNSSESDQNDTWREKTIANPQVPIMVPLPNAAVVTIDGGPSLRDDRLYELTISAAGQSKTITVYGAGALNGTPIHEQLLNLPVIAANVQATVFYRYDQGQTIACGLQVDGLACVNLPFDPTNSNWVLGHGLEGTLTVAVHATAQGVPVDATAPIPLVGQVLSIVS